MCPIQVITGADTLAAILDQNMENIFLDFKGSGVGSAIGVLKDHPCRHKNKCKQHTKWPSSQLGFKQGTSWDKPHAEPCGPHLSPREFIFIMDIGGVSWNSSLPMHYSSVNQLNNISWCAVWVPGMKCHHRCACRRTLDSAIKWRNREWNVHIVARSDSVSIPNW